MDDDSPPLVATTGRPTLEAKEALARALEASWDEQTAYQGVVLAGNPAYGQCYPTSHVLQWFYPEYEILRGEVLTPVGAETHFWNAHVSDLNADWIDLSWSQFPPGSRITSFEVLDRASLGDSPATQARCELLRDRVLDHLRTSPMKGNLGSPPARG